MAAFTWDDLRVVLAISPAARRLALPSSWMSATARSCAELATLELALDPKLFRRSEGRLIVRPPAAA